MWTLNAITSILVKETHRGQWDNGGKGHNDVATSPGIPRQPPEADRGKEQIFLEDCLQNY